MYLRRAGLYLSGSLPSPASVRKSKLMSISPDISWSPERRRWSDPAWQPELHSTIHTIHNGSSPSLRTSRYLLYTNTLSRGRPVTSRTMPRASRLPKALVAVG